MYNKNLRHEHDKAKCFAVIDFFILPKATAPAWTISCKEEELYERRVYVSLIDI